MIKRSVKRVVWLVALLLVGGGALLGTPLIQARASSAAQPLAPTAVPVTHPLMSLDSTSLPATLVSQSVIAGEDVVTNWTDASGDTITLAGPTGSILDIALPDESLSGTPTGGTLEDDFSVTPPPISTTDITGDQAIAQYKASGLSLYQDAVAVGFSTTAAQQMVKENADGKIISHLCANWRWKKLVKSHECTIQHLIQHDGKRDWYIANKTVASAASTDHAAMIAFGTWITYKGNQRIDWSPASTIHVGSCHTETFTVNGPNGFPSFSFSKTICPQKLTPHFPKTAGFGATWRGHVCPGTWEEDPSLSLEYDAGGARADRYMLHGEAAGFPPPFGC